MEKVKAKLGLVVHLFVAGCVVIIMFPLYCYVMIIAMIGDKLAGRD